jgi:hypothetical protein
MKFVLFSMQEIKSFRVRGVFILGVVFLGGVPGISLNEVISQHVPQTPYSASVSAPEWAVLMHESTNQVSADYTVTDARGRIVQSGIFLKSFRLDITDQPSGVYLFSTGVVTSRLIVK